METALDGGGLGSVVPSLFQPIKEEWIGRHEKLVARQIGVTWAGQRVSGPGKLRE